MIAYGKDQVKTLMEQDKNIIDNTFLVYENDVIVAMCDSDGEATALCSALNKKEDAEYTYRYNPA